jgi:hypothetical protein
MAKISRASALLGLVLAGCFDSVPLELGNPTDLIAIGTDLVLDDRPSEALWRIAAPTGTDAPTPERLDVAGNKIGSIATPAGDARLLLFAEPGKTTRRALRVAAAPAPLAVAETAAPFSAIRSCDDGQAGLLFHIESSTATSLVNTAEVGVVDFVAGKVLRATVGGLGRVPYEAGCSAPLSDDPSAHRLVWVLARSVIGLVDVGPDGAESVVVPLVAPGSDALVRPRQVVAVVEGVVVHLYVVADGSKDVLHLRVTLGTGAPAVSLDQIGVGGSPLALTLFGEGASLRAVTLNAAPASISLVDPGTGASQTFALDAPAGTWRTYARADGSHEAIAFTPSGSERRVSRIALDSLAKKKGKAVATWQAEWPISDVRVAGERLAILHTGTAAITMADLETGKLTPFQGTGNILAAVVRPDAVYVLGGTSQGGWYDDGSRRLSRIALADLTGASLELKGAPQVLRPFGSAGVALAGGSLSGQWVAVWPAGTVPADDGSPAPVHWLEGFAMHGLLDQEVP